MSNTAKNRIKSTWTPLTNKDANIKIWFTSYLNNIYTLFYQLSGSIHPIPEVLIYEERRELVNKWFEKWSGVQRNRLLTDLVSRCSRRQLDRAGADLDRIRPQNRLDFVQRLPRVVSLYVFSFLDPRSLSRASQVSWNWKQVTELDQLWMAKSLRLGWILSFAPSPFEHGVWKRFYLQNIVDLQSVLPKNNAKNNELNNKFAKDEKDKNKKGNINSLEISGRRPWMNSDPKPTDIRRNNYLENDDTVDKINKIRKRPQFGIEAYEMINKTKGRVDTRLNCGEKPSLITKNHDTKPKFIENRPKWAKHCPGSAFMALSQVADNNIDAGVRPKSLHSSVADLNAKLLRSSLTRTPRDPPTSRLFLDKPWKLPSPDSD